MKKRRAHKINLTLIDASAELTTCNWLTTIPFEEHGFYLAKTLIVSSTPVLRTQTQMMGSKCSKNYFLRFCFHL